MRAKRQEENKVFSYIIMLVLKCTIEDNMLETVLGLASSINVNLPPISHSHWIWNLVSFMIAEFNVEFREYVSKFWVPHSISQHVMKC